ncbi:bacillithiol biosynthesis cysteine-adding enzyme BshC [Paenibacillus filicis]|uniref:Putative cysteine ligase BshC n=1 Tax=Paenibacillus gyeongsangnamensis TaxID=3388067 RepID=A0ABT4Q2W1_9BACL|nr:bacillithiol biosynthesis cysteine-adding enzyme BshC [Paenibacillus filicis]MCZ8511220.1 bacillithiol biosynthesis cysteine-adding enzyme BshC [Paenibacillus filicis]
MEVFHWNSGQPLTEDYLQRYGNTEPLYEYEPFQTDSWKRRAEWLDTKRAFGADRGALADALKRFNEKAGAAPEALAAIEALRDPGTLAIVGGQQAGLFTGPLLVIYKAVTIIREAKRASELLNRRVVPVFWIAGEDHDFDEVNHVIALTPELELNRIKLEHPTGLRTSVSRTPISAEQWEDAIGQLDTTLIPTEFKAGLLESLRALAAKSDTLVDLFAGLLASLFSRYGLILVDSDDPGLRRLEGPMFRTLLERNGELGQALKEAKAELVRLGYEPQAEVSERSANLFVFDPEERILLYQSESGGFTDRKEERHYSLEGLLDWAETAPERLSNNVMTRPLMQDYLFPVLGAVLGSSEIAYWGLTRRAFELFGMNMPILIPRTGYTLLEGTVQKNMGKYGLAVEDALFRLEERQQAWLQEQDRLQLSERFQSVKEDFRERYAPLVELLGEVNPGLKKLGDTNLSKILEQIDFLEHKAEDAVKSQHESGLRQFQRVGMSILPDGKPQERIYNVFAYLNKYGEGWLQELLDASYDVDGHHFVCYM